MLVAKERKGRSFMLSSKEIARRAGLSQPTVSRILNGFPGVKEETRKRVLQIVQESGYTPNALARGLATRRTRSLGLVVSNITNPFYPEFVDAVEQACSARGYQMLLWTTHRNKDVDQPFIDSILQRRVEGCIFASVLNTSPALEGLIQRGFPVVLANRYLLNTRSDTVISDNELGGRVLTDHFLGLGHRRIGFVQGHPETTTSQDRESGYRQALAAAGLSVDASCIYQGDFTRETAYQTGRLIAALPDRPTALIAADDLTAIGLMDGLWDGGLLVPKDVALAGFDDIALSSSRYISLTTVKQSPRLMAQNAISLVLSRIEDGTQGAPNRVVLVPELIVRQTCGAQF